MQSGDHEILHSKKKVKLELALKKIEYLNKQLVNTSTPEDVFSQIKQLEGIIDILIAEKTQSAAFRSKCKLLNENETNSKYFFNKERCNFNKKTMSILKRDDGTIIDNRKSIMEEQKTFMQSYTKVIQMSTLPSKISPVGKLPLTRNSSLNSQ